MPIKLRFVLQRGRQWVRHLLPLLFLLSLVMVFGVGQVTSAAIGQESRQEIRGVWMTLNDMDVLKDQSKLQDAIHRLRQLNFNTVYPVVWNSGYVMYPSPVAQRTGIQPFIYTGLAGQDIIADVTAQAHQQGLLVIPWFEFGLMAPSTSELALSHPDWLTQKRDGTQTSVNGAGEVMWLNPFLPSVQKIHYRSGYRSRYSI